MVVLDTAHRGVRSETRTSARTPSASRPSRRGWRRTEQALISTVVYRTQPPHGSGELEAIQLRDRYRADGLTLTVEETPGDSARIVLALRADTLTLSRPDHLGLPPTTYHRVLDAGIPDVFVGLWVGRQSVVDVGIAFDVELGLRLRADGTVALESGGETVADPGIGPEAVVLGRYVLLRDARTTYHGDPGGTELTFFSLAELSGDGERLRWTDAEGRVWTMRRSPGPRRPPRR